MSTLVGSLWRTQLCFCSLKKEESEESLLTLSFEHIRRGVGGEGVVGTQPKSDGTPSLNNSIQLSSSSY